MICMYTYTYIIYVYVYTVPVYIYMYTVYIYTSYTYVHSKSTSFHLLFISKSLSLWLHLGDSLDCWCHFLPQSTEQSSFRGVVFSSFLWWISWSSCWDWWISCITCISRFCLNPGFWSKFLWQLDCWWCFGANPRWSNEAYQQNHSPSSSWGRRGSCSPRSLQIDV